DTTHSIDDCNRHDLLVEVYGVEIAKELLEIGDQRLEIGDQGDEGQSPVSNLQSTNLQSPISVFGFVGPPSLHRANRGQIMLYVNGRWIRDNSLTYAVIQAYHTLLPTGRYPLAVVFVQMPFDQVDVNVHPAKDRKSVV